MTFQRSRPFFRLYPFLVDAMRQGNILREWNLAGWEPRENAAFLFGTEIV